VACRVRLCVIEERSPPRERVLSRAASAAKTEKRSEQSQAQASAPLGSRIKRKSNVNPVANVNMSEELAQGRVQQNARHSRASQ